VNSGTEGLGTDWAKAISTINILNNTNRAKSIKAIVLLKLIPNNNKAAAC
jgi:hypothetical protein